MNGVRQQFMHDSKLLAVERLGERDNTRNIAARSIEACDQTLLHGGRLHNRKRSGLRWLHPWPRGPQVRWQRPQLRAPESEPSPRPVPKGGTDHHLQSDTQSLNSGPRYNPLLSILHDRL